MRFLLIAFLFLGCMNKSGDSIDNVIEESLKRKEGVDIRIDPIKEQQ